MGGVSSAGGRERDSGGGRPKKLAGLAVSRVFFNEPPKIRLQCILDFIWFHSFQLCNTLIRIKNEMLPFCLE